MNRLMQMKSDKDVIAIESATEEEIEEFEEGTTTGPDLDPMCPFLASSKRNSWNDTLCEMFIEHFTQEMAQLDIELTDEGKDTVEAMFLDRLARLSRQWREARKFTGHELFERKRDSNVRARRNTRRVDVSRGLNS